MKIKTFFYFRILEKLLIQNRNFKNKKSNQIKKITKCNFKN